MRIFLSQIFKQHMNLHKPKLLVHGDTIGIISPSAGLAQIVPHRVQKAVETLGKLGYKVKFATNALSRDEHVSATAKKRAEDIHEMFRDTNVNAIMCAIGGNHANQVLKYLDFDCIRENKKIFIGYSDISVLHYALYTQANLQTYYGPCLLTQFGEHPQVLEYTSQFFKKALTEHGRIGVISPSGYWTDEVLNWFEQKDLERPRALQTNKGYEWLRDGEAHGAIVGGCIPSIHHLAGTRYWIDPTKKIFFLDIPEGHEFAKGLSIADLDASLADLDNLGVFSLISGLVVGRPFNTTEENIVKIKERILHYTHGEKYPILFNVNIGHADPIITIPFGAQARLNSNENLFSLDA